MLVLGRNLGETIVINDDIIITVFETNKVGNKFKVAIDAPKDVKIVRGELCDNLEEHEAKLQQIRERQKAKSL